MNSIVNFASFTAHFPRFVLISVNRLTNEADIMTPPAEMDLSRVAGGKVFRDWGLGPFYVGAT